MKQFYQVLVNTLIANVTTNFLWFALTFWVYLETQSVLATAFIGGSYMMLIAFLGILFGTLVDRHRKKQVMIISTVVTLITYLIAGLIYTQFEKSQLVDWTSIVFWLFSGLILVGAVVQSMRNIALSTVVTLLVQKEKRDKANGMVGTVQGVAFTITSVFSGLSIAVLGMGWTLALSIILTALALVHLLFVSIPEKKILHDPSLGDKKIDIRGSLQAIQSAPGLVALILFSTFNNFVGGVHMTLMDPYGLTLFSVEVWGIMLGVVSTGFIIGGILVSRLGLGRNPLRTLLLVNIGMGMLAMIFAIREVWLFYIIGLFLYMCLIPLVEASEQTVIQRIVPFQKQGRVFGLAQSVESAATPITAFLIGPIAQFLVIPYMQGDAGRAQWEWLVGAGDARGMALIFIAAGLLTFTVTLLAFRTKAYSKLSAVYKES